MLGAPKLKDDLGFLHVVSQYGRKCADWETQKLGLNPVSCTALAKSLLQISIFFSVKQNLDTSQGCED